MPNVHNQPPATAAGARARSATTLEAGRELDALVAERVMEWGLGAGFENDTYWPFSTDIAYAFGALHALRMTLVTKHGENRVQFSLMQVAAGHWICRVIVLGSHDDGVPDEIIASADSDDPAHAVCLAALVSVGAIDA